METYQIIVKGRVQGVGYRAHIYQNASQKDLHGNVRNLSDGSVQIILQGTEEDLKKMLQIVHKKAHPFMNAQHVDTKTIPSVKEYNDFSIIY
ncbi:acylphosphatase [Aerococcaceae bacterium WS4759]|uniref:acylphosphatase n=1 Tax=Fundicoccus ignavus TaxID=2664442 RepID=A0A6I2GAS1_9LACT|nr:acylphosphatase [Fundicoccus ignavus]MRI84860.1 acylphosphatase [Fundicoccus ignavus]